MYLKTIDCVFCVFFFFNDTATTEIYTLSLHDALPISSASRETPTIRPGSWRRSLSRTRSEEHTSELQSPQNLVCRLLLEKKNAANGARTEGARERGAAHSAESGAPARRSDPALTQTRGSATRPCAPPAVFFFFKERGPPEPFPFPPPGLFPS